MIRLATICLGLFTCAAAQSLDTLQKGFMAKYDTTNADRDEKLEKLSTGYASALQRLLDEIKRTGDLDAVLPVRDEITAIESDTWPLRELSAAAPQPLRALRDKYVEARDKIVKDHATELVALVDKMQALLKDKEAALTRAGELDAAVAARNMAETLQNDKAIDAARNMVGVAAPPLSGQEEWISLRKAEMKITEHKFLVSWVDDVITRDPTTTSIPPPVKELASKEADLAGVMLYSIAPATIEFTTRHPITHFRCEVFLGSNLGDVDFSVTVGGKVVKNVPMKQRAGSRKLECTFEPTRTIVLAVDENGDSYCDWSTWVRPEVR